MIAVANIDRIRTFKRALTRRPLRHARERRVVVNGLSRS